MKKAENGCAESNLKYKTRAEVDDQHGGIVSTALNAPNTTVLMHIATIAYKPTFVAGYQWQEKQEDNHRLGGATTL